MRVKSVGALFLGVCSFCLLTPTSFAQDVVRQKATVKSGVISLSRDDDKMVWTLKLGKKVLLTDENDNAAIGGPYVIGDTEIISFGSACGGSSCGDDYATKLFLIDSKGNVKPAKITGLDGKNREDFDCTWFLDDNSNPLLKDDTLSFQCTKIDGRKQKTVYWNYSNGNVVESRTSDVWKK